MSEMKTVNGDLIQLALAGNFDVIIHGCNCFCTMGAGIAKSIKEVFPEAYNADLATGSGDQEKLGTISTVKVTKNRRKITVVNAYTQYHYTGDRLLVDYDALRSCFQQIKKEFSGLKIGYPKIGAGLAGGNWNIIAKIIEAELLDEDHTLVNFSR